MRRSLVVSAAFLALLWGSRLSAAPTTNGLYAGFQTTMGTFYCVLRYDLTPRTAANFVSLADGSKDWLDYSKAAVVKKRFYQGLSFHRVIKGFVIQGGSPNGQGTDDPGYRFRDEITNSLTHNRAGILAMANSGTNSNGSQFYITLAPQPFLDGQYTIFGSVVEGLNVVTNIGNVNVDTNSRPVIPVFMTNVFILRIGSAASNFNATAIAPALPIPRVKTSRIFFVGPDLVITWPYLAGYEYRVCNSGDLRTWTGSLVGEFSGGYVNISSRRFYITFETKID